MKLPFLKKPVTQSPSLPITGKLAKGVTSVKDIIAPPAIEVDFNHLKINHALFKSLFVAGYPRFVSPNWLVPLIEFGHSLDIAMFVYPIEGKGILDELRRKVGEMEAEIQTDVQRGRIPNVHTQIALEDARKLQEQLAKGAERFFQFGLYITIPGESTEELESTAKKVEAALGSLMIVAKPTTLQMEDGFLTTLPICCDKLMITRNMDTTCLATTFPFTSSELSANEGILYGINEHNDSLIIFDRFSLENYNLCMFGKAGSGKSIIGHENVLYKDNSGTIKQARIGKLVNSLIQKHGAEKIDEEMEGIINPGLEVFTFDKNLRGKWAKVTVAARKPISKRSLLYKITTKSGREITVTPDHNLIVLRNGKIRAMRGQAVKIGESIPLPRFIPEPTQTINSFKNVSFTPDLFEILGFYTSEGSILANSTRISSTHPEILKHLKSILEKLKLQWTPIKGRGRIEGISILSKSLVKFLHAVGAAGTAGTKRIPSILWQSKNQLVAAYLQAYFEGDGTVDSKGRVSAISKSKQLVSDLAYLLLRFGIIGRIRKKFRRATNSNHQGDTYYQIVVSGQKDLSRFAKKIGFLTQEKSKKLKKLLGKKYNTNVDVVPSLEPIFKEINRILYSSTEVKSPVYFSDVKCGKREPSRESLKQLIQSIETRVAEIKTTSPNYNMFWLAKTVDGETLEVPAAERETTELFQIEKRLEWLKTLANSDLLWDPIVKIEKVKNRNKYVYDLTVDNEVFLAGFGGMFVHNSYCVKAEILRSLMFGTEIIVIDPENEYRTLTQAVEGEYIDFSFQSPTKINPFDLSQTKEGGDQLAQKILALHSLLKIMLGKMSPDEEAILDRALVLTYKQKGISQDPATQKREPPLMEDLYKTLFGMEEKEAKTLTNRLERYVKGGLAGIFNQKSNVEFTNPFTVFGIKDLETELRPAAMFIILDFIWNKIKSELKKRILVVDEAWYLMKYPDSALFLYSIAKRARKYYLGLTTITQDVEDFLESKHGKQIIQNSSIQILMKQSPAAIDKVGEVFYLSEGEKNLLLSADIGHGLFFAGLTHVALHVVASEEEHKLITTKPAELIEMRKKTIEKMKEEKSGKMKVDEPTGKGLQSPRAASSQPEDR